MKTPEITDIKYLCVFPNYYEYGLPNIGIQTIYRECYNHSNVLPDRYYLPREEWNDKHLTWEQRLPAAEYDIIGFSVSYEGDYLNILKCLEYFGLPLKASMRDENSPILIGGGPVMMYNPLPLADFFDAFILGEGEDVIHEVLDVYQKNKERPKHEILAQMANIRGVFIPSIHSGVHTVQQTLPVDIDKNPAYSIFITKYTVYEEETFTIEVRRGCNQKCRFCYMGTRLRPARTLSYETFTALVDLGLKYCSIIKCFYEGLETSTIEKYLSYVEEHHGRLRVGSQRLEMLSEKIIAMMAAAGQRKLIIAPESSERLRKVIGKERIKNEDIIKYMDVASEKGISDIGLYFIIGLPGERKEDLDEIVNIIFLVRQHMNQLGNRTGHLEIGINPLYPKPFTAFQYAAATYPEEAKEKLTYILRQISESYPVLISTDFVDEKVEKRVVTDKDNSIVKVETTIGTAVVYSQPILSRGDMRLGDVLLDMYRREDTIENWKECMRSHDLISSDYFRGYFISEEFPWDFQKCLVSSRHLTEEYTLAMNYEPSSQCFADCSKCQTRCMI